MFRITAILMNTAALLAGFTSIRKGEGAQFEDDLSYFEEVQLALFK